MSGFRNHGTVPIPLSIPITVSYEKFIMDSWIIDIPYCRQCSYTLKVQDKKLFWVPFNPISYHILIPWVPPPTLSEYPTLFLLYPVKHTCIRTYHAKVEVPWFKTVELAADQKSDLSAQNLDNSKNQNLYKENHDPNFFKSRQNLTKVAKSL